LALKKLRQEKTILEFTLAAANVEADEDETTNTYFDGTPVVRALSVTITNTGQKPVTILEVKCRWSVGSKAGEEYQKESREWVNKKLGQGDHCFAYPHLHTRPHAIISAWAIDSTGKEWLAPATLIEQLNAKGPKQWH
jgi:hypothetical protein